MQSNKHCSTCWCFGSLLPTAPRPHPMNAKYIVNPLTPHLLICQSHDTHMLIMWYPHADDTFVLVVPKDITSCCPPTQPHHKMNIFCYLNFEYLIKILKIKNVLYIFFIVYNFFQNTGLCNKMRSFFKHFILFYSLTACMCGLWTWLAVPRSARHSEKGAGGERAHAIGSNAWIWTGGWSESFELLKV